MQTINCRFKERRIRAKKQEVVEINAVCRLKSEVRSRYRRSETVVQRTTIHQIENKIEKGIKVTVKRLEQ